MALVSNVRYRTVLFVAVLILAAPRAHAEQITHQFTGQLTTITNGSGGSLDLTGVFTLGQSVTLEYTIERATPPVQQDAHTSAYTDAITALSFSVDSWSGSGTPGSSNTTVVDDAPYDEYSATLQGGISAPPIGGSTLQSLTYTFDDVQGTVFDSTVIPREFPALGAFEGKTFTILLFDFAQLKSGYVMATLAGVTTPAQATTWGGVKALYR